MKYFPPTPEEISDWMEEHELSRGQVAKLVDVSPRMVSYWKSGKWVMPYTVYFTLRTKVEGKPPS